MDRVYTGFESLDKHLKIYKGDLVVIGSRPAIGKTCLMSSMIEKTKDKQKIIFFSMQVNKHKAIERLLLSNAKENNNFYLHDRFVDYEDLLLIVVERKLKHGVDVVFIDNAYDLYEYTHHSEKETTKKLKELALKLNVAIIIADSCVWSNKKLSCYSDLRRKSLIKHADKIIMINRHDLTATEKEMKDGLVEKGVAEISIDKNMEEYYSPLIKLKFDKNTYAFIEIAEKP